jgi:hypothetical protein
VSVAFFGAKVDFAQFRRVVWSLTRLENRFGDFALDDHFLIYRLLFHSLDLVV